MIMACIKHLHNNYVNFSFDIVFYLLKVSIASWISDNMGNSRHDDR